MAISYRDRCYCVSPNCRNECGSQLTGEVIEGARKWWLDVTKGKSDEAPISMAYFCDENGEYVI